MYWISNGFIFRKIDSPIHRLDPRVKLLISIQLFTLAILVSNIYDLLIIFIAITIFSTLGKITTKLLKTMIFAMMFSLLILGINYLAGYSIFYSIQIALRFISIICSTSLFFLVTSPDELEYVLRWFKLPNDIVFAFVTAVRFVPVILIDALQIMDAQKSRGLELDKGNPISRIKKFIPILVPLIINEVIRSGELAEAMESRAYGAIKKPTSLYKLKFSQRDGISTITTLFIFFIIIIFQPNIDYAWEELLKQYGAGVI